MVKSMRMSNDKAQSSKHYALRFEHLIFDGVVKSQKTVIANEVKQSLPL